METIQPASQGYGIIVQQDGKPQQVLAKFLNLMLNYQFGLSILVAPSLPRASSLLMEHDAEVCCAFIVHSEKVENKTVIGVLSKHGEIPVFMVVPQSVIEAQQEVCAELSNIFYCAWEKAFSRSAESLQKTATAILEEYGIGDVMQDADDVPFEALQQRVETRMRNINTLPTLPEIVMRIMRLVNDPKTTTEQLEQLLCTDPAIVMKLLQVVKSPTFASTVQRGSWSLSEIIVRLGLKKVGAIAQQIKMINSLVKPEESEFDLRRFWEHSVGSAIIADRLYSKKMLPLKTSLEFNDYWIAALLHDIGKLVLGFFFWDWFNRVVEQVEKSGKAFRAVETRMGEAANHERIGQFLVINANMGEELATVIGTHHALGETSELACLVHIANNLAKEFELGYLSDEPAHYDKRALAALGIKASQIEEVRAELAGDIVEEIKTMVEQCL
jgi:HD-like signal output (HDOD) protein